MENAYRSELGRLGFSLEERSRLETYLGLLERWSRRINLTGARTVHDRVEILVARILPALSFLRPGRVIDVGSGNGSPGIVFAALRRSSSFTLLEPRLRRWAFLREVARALALDNVEIRRERHQEYSGPPARTVTIRGLAFSPGALDPLVEPGGRLVCFGGGGEPGARYKQIAAIHDLHVWARCST